MLLAYIHALSKMNPFKSDSVATHPLNINVVQFTGRKLEQIRNETAKNAEFCELAYVILNDWPERHKFKTPEKILDISR